MGRINLAFGDLGTHRPSYDTAKALAGWTVEQVMEAADHPVHGDAAP